MDHSCESARIEIVAPDSSGASEILRSYIDDVASTYYGRAATDEEIDAALLDDPSDDLAAPRGVFIVAQEGDVALGCAGLRLLPEGVGEVCRIFVAPHARHPRTDTQGDGAVLLVLTPLELERRHLGIAAHQLGAHPPQASACHEHGRAEQHPRLHGFTPTASM